MLEPIRDVIAMLASDWLNFDPEILQELTLTTSCVCLFFSSSNFDLIPILDPNIFYMDREIKLPSVLILGDIEKKSKANDRFWPKSEISLGWETNTSE